MITGQGQIAQAQHDALLKIYGEENQTVLKSSCIKFDENMDLCKTCYYFSSLQQEQKCGRVCELWENVFGSELQKQLILYMNKGIRVGSKFMDLWHARKIAIPAAVPQRAAIKHSPDVQSIANGGMTVSQLNPQGVKVHKSTKGGAPTTENDGLGFTVNIVEVTRGQ